MKYGQERTGFVFLATQCVAFLKMDLIQDLSNRGKEIIHLIHVFIPLSHYINIFSKKALFSFLSLSNSRLSCNILESSL